jgi:murein DD-endopeptidase MepM/ murein hydrolase activator NlpD
MILALVGVRPGHGQTRAGAGKPAPGGRPASASPALGHVVRPGDTLWMIAREHGITMESLIRANRLPPKARLRVGQRLALPLGAVDGERQEPPSMADIVLTPPPSPPQLHFIRPVPGIVASPFGPRGVAWHGGVDLKAEQGTSIQAAAAGMVIMSGWERAYGHVVKIWHPHNLMTVYAHNHENLVKVADWVEQGQVIATVGGTGRATAPHLHFEIRLDGRKFNPLFWLPEVETFAAPVREPANPAAALR